MLLWEGNVENQKTIVFNVPDEAQLKNKLKLNIAISNPMSPHELGVSSDTRKLGIGILKLQIQ